MKDFDEVRCLITKNELAMKMQVTPRTISGWMRKGLVPFRKIGRTVRFLWPEVAAAQRPSLSARSKVLTPTEGVAASLRERAKQIRRGQ